MSSKVRILLIVAPLFTVLDQLTKVMVREWIPKGDKIVVIPKLFNLIHVENPGAAWGLMGGHEHRLTIFLLVSLVAFVVIGFYFRSLPTRETWLAGALSLILSGAVGNFIDRALFHKVTDFLDFYVGWQGGLREFVLNHSRTTHYPTFNVADMAIVFGVFIFLVHVLFVEPRRAREAKRDQAQQGKATDRSQ